MTLYLYFSEWRYLNNNGTLHMFSYNSQKYHIVVGDVDVFI